MVLTITLYGNPVLRQRGARIDPITDDHRQLAQDLVDTMRVANGLGLAAQQVGHALQLAVVDVTPVDEKERPSKMWIDQKEVDIGKYMPLVLLNPEIKLVKSKETGWEGCLSFPGIDAEISRPKRVHVKTQQLNGSLLEFDAAGLLGRAIQHEYDHLQGILFTDRMFSESKKLLKEKIDAIRVQGEAQAA